jgi:hypothetical protein
MANSRWWMAPPHAPYVVGRVHGTGCLSVLHQGLEGLRLRALQSTRCGVPGPKRAGTRRSQQAGTCPPGPRRTLLSPHQQVDLSHLLPVVSRLKSGPGGEVPQALPRARVPFRVLGLVIGQEERSPGPHSVIQTDGDSPQQLGGLDSPAGDHLVMGIHQHRHMNPKVLISRNLADLLRGGPRLPGQALVGDSTE